MIIRPRSYFGWEQSRADTAKPWRGTVIHYNGRATNLDTHAECVAYWQRVRSFHMSANGWVDIGYSFGVCRHAEAFTGRGLYRYQAAQGTTAGNSDFYSVTLMLGGCEVPTDEQMDGVRALREHLAALGGGEQIRPHYEFFDTECPGPVVTGLMRQGRFGPFPDLALSVPDHSAPRAVRATAAEGTGGRLEPGSRRQSR